jgi:hypothetical protein
VRLEPLCVLELAFEGTLEQVRAEGIGGRFYGVGTGTVTGDRVSGSIRWTNHPRIRPDGTTVPEVYGAITLPGGETILIEMHGISVAIDGGPQRDTRTSATFIAGDGGHAWLNDVFCVCEGAFDMATGRSRFAVFECVNELVSDSTDE